MENPFQVISTQLELITKMLQTLLEKEKPVIVAKSNEYLNIKEASAMIFLAVPTIYGLVAQREIPHFKRGKRLYFSKAELANWLNEGKRRTNQEISKQAENYLLKKNRKN